MRAIVALAASLGVLAASTGGAEPDEPRPQPRRLSGELIAFSADLDGNWDFYEGNANIFVMDPDGGPPRNLTRQRANDFSPEWSPDGKQIAFRTDRDGNHEIYVP